MQLAKKRQGGAGNPLYGQTRLCVREGSTLDAPQEKMEGLRGEREKGKRQMQVICSATTSSV